MAFCSLLNNMELIKRVYLNAAGGSRQEPITKDELLHSAQTMSQITPLEIDILFQLTGAIHQTGWVDQTLMLRSHRLSHGKIKRKFLAAINADFLMRKVGGRNQLVMTRGKSGFPSFPPRKFINFLHDFRSIFIFHFSPWFRQHWFSPASPVD